MAIKFQFRRDTATNWGNVNPVLDEGEMGLDTTNNNFKIGDGSTAWSSLSWFAGGSGVTDLSIGTKTGTTLDINSSTGTNATIPASTTTYAGLMTEAQFDKLDGIEASANNYVHPSSDGNLHVPATSTTNNGKVLTAGATAGSLSWTTISGTTNLSVGTKTSTTLDINSSSGTNVTIPASSSTEAGLMTSTQYTSLSNAVSTTTNNTFTKAQRVSFKTITYASSITPNFNDSNKYKVTLTGNLTIANPSNLVEGQGGVIYLLNDSTAGHTLSWGTYFKFPITASHDTSPNTLNIYTYEVYSTTVIIVTHIGSEAL